MLKFTKQNLPTVLVFFAVIFSSFYFGYPRLKTFSGIDEPLWSYGRVPTFWNAIGKAKLKATTICDKPGVTLAAISGIGLPFAPEKPKGLEELRYQPKSQDELQKINDLYFFLRLPVFLFSILILPVFYFFTKKLFKKRTALIATIFIGMSPILLGISLMINTDAILWSMLPLTLMSFLIYQKENDKKFLCLTGFLLGISLIDKYIANILFPFFFGLIFLKYIVDDKTHENKNYLKSAFADYGLLILVSLATIFVFFPAAWIKPKTILDVTIFSKAFYKTWYIFFAIVVFGALDTYLLKSFVFEKICNFFNLHKKWLLNAIYATTIFLILFVVANVYSGMKFFDFQPVFNSPSSQLQKINTKLGEPNVIMLSAFYPLIFGLTPIVTVFFLYSIGLSGFSKIKDEKNYNIFILLLFILFYYLGSAACGVGSTVRYQIALFPIASIIAAAGLGHFIGLKKIKKYFSDSGFGFIILLFFIFAASVFSLKSINPFFLSYASDLLPKKYVLNFRDMGDGSWEAAQYLNRLPDAKNIQVWSDKGGVCEAFVGRCSDSLKSSKTKDVKFDYFVITAGREVKSLNSHGQTKTTRLNGIELKKIYSIQENVFRLNIDGREDNYVKIIKAEDLR